MPGTASSETALQLHYARTLTRGRMENVYLLSNTLFLTVVQAFPPFTC